MRPEPGCSLKDLPELSPVTVGPLGESWADPGDVLRGAKAGFSPAVLIQGTHLQSVL